MNDEQRRRLERMADPATCVLVLPAVEAVGAALAEIDRLTRERDQARYACIALTKDGAELWAALGQLARACELADVLRLVPARSRSEGYLDRALRRARKTLEDSRPKEAGS